MARVDLPELDPLIHQRTRLQILTLLNRNREVPLALAREQLDLTYGNLAGHSDKLEEAGYLERRRKLTPDGFQVRLRITEQGQRAFEAYLQALRIYLEPDTGQPLPDEPDARPEGTG